MITRYWTRGRRGDSVSPFGDPHSVLTNTASADQVLRSVATWCDLNGLSYRVGVCSDPRTRATRLENSLVELHRQADGDLVHAVYVRKPWRYMHVIFRTIDRSHALMLRDRFIDVGRSLGRCENGPRDLLEPVIQPPFFVYLLTGHLPQRVEQPPAPAAAPAPSLLGIADL